jgi:hypothetical protein
VVESLFTKILILLFVCAQDNQSGGNRGSCCLGVWAELLEISQSVKVTEYVFHCLATW